MSFLDLRTRRQAERAHKQEYNKMNSTLSESRGWSVLALELNVFKPNVVRLRHAAYSCLQ